VRGRGAGRWPTTESIIADVLSLARDDAPLAGAVADDGTIERSGAYG